MGRYFFCFVHVPVPGAQCCHSSPQNIPTITYPAYSPSTFLYQLCHRIKLSRQSCDSWFVFPLPPSSRTFVTRRRNWERKDVSMEIRDNKSLAVGLRFSRSRERPTRPLDQHTPTESDIWFMHQTSRPLPSGKVTNHKIKNVCNLSINIILEWTFIWKPKNVTRAWNV